MPIELLLTSPAAFFAWLVAIIYAITVHEFSHALVGHLQGDTTAEDQGRLTLNPLSHIDLMGLALMILAGFGWGKPVPFNPYNLRFKKFGPVLVAFAGPIANLLSVVLFAVILKVLVVTGVPTQNLIYTLLSFLIEINVVLMLFNLIPIPPLDGSKLLYSVLGVKHLQVISWLEQYGIWLLFAVVVIGSPWLSLVFGWVINLVYTIAL